MEKHFVLARFYLDIPKSPRDGDFAFHNQKPLRGNWIQRTTEKERLGRRMQRTKKFFKGCSALLAGVSIPLLALIGYLNDTLPDRFYVTEGEPFAIHSGFDIKTSEQGRELLQETYGAAGNLYTTDLKLWGGLELKPVTVEVVDRVVVAPGGTPFGIKMFTRGVMVVGMSSVETADGLVNPAKEAGLQMGDMILSLNGKEVAGNEEVARVVAQSGGDVVLCQYSRGGEKKTARLYPVRCAADGSYKLGIWVRDSSAGIGTLTFCDFDSRIFAGLGHGVCDVDTRELLPLMSGEVVDVTISSVVKGRSGSPGELRGSFRQDGRIGSLRLNSETGVFGTLELSYVNPYQIPLGYRQEVEEGPASILTTISGSQPQEFAIQIEKVNFSDESPTKNMVIRITDPVLLEKTGGIVQGMSGSPILQNGKLVGAVTHVFVNDPARGYGIFAENMYQTANFVETERGE